MWRKINILFFHYIYGDSGFSQRKKKEIIHLPSLSTLNDRILEREYEHGLANWLGF